MGASFKLPADLLVLIDAGVWPTPDNELKQHLTPTAPTDAIKRFAADEDNLYLYPPSFRTVASHAKLNGFGAITPHPSNLISTMHSFLEILAWVLTLRSSSTTQTIVTILL